MFKSKLQESVEQLETANADLQSKIDEMTIELNSHKDQSEKISTLETQVSEQKESITDLTTKLETAESKNLDFDLAVSKKVADEVADLGVEAVETDEDDEKSIFEQYRSLKGKERQEFYAKNKTEILKTAKLNHYTK